MQTDVNGPRGRYDIPIQFEQMTQPGYEAGNGSNALYHGMHNSRFETYLLAVTDPGQVISLDFTGEAHVSLEKLQKRWSRSALQHGPEHTGPIASRLFTTATTDPVRMLLMGTPFQLRGYRWGTWRKRAFLDWERSLAGQQRTLFQPTKT
jgi:O6-methylguanine-DNA--protein-cysteine methyltransferase